MVKRIKKLMFLSLGTLLGTGANFLLQIYLAKEFNLHDYGIYTSVLNIVNLLSPLIGFGVASFILKIYMVEGVGARRWLAQVYHLILINLIVVFFIIQVWGWVNNKNFSMFWVYSFFFIYMVGVSLNSFVISRYQIENEINKLSVWQLIPNTLKLISVIGVFVFLNKTIFSISIGYLLAGIAMLIFSISSIEKLRTGNLKIDNKNIEDNAPVKKIDLIRKSFPYGLTGIFYLIYIQSSVLITTFIKTYEDVAYLGLALVFLTALCLLPSIFFQKLYMPKIHFWSKNDIYKIREFSKKSKKIWFFVSLFMIISYLIFIKFYFIDIFGLKYQNKIGIFYCIAVLVFIKYFSLNLGAIMSTEKLIKNKAKYMTFAALSNIILSFPLIYFFDIYGSIWALSMVELYLCFVFAKNIKNEYEF